ncbi:sterol desaturase family protein [Oceanirhabdus seepicola]|uniref:Sterol desaturase family protein n=1 Tax=Oceanirhabdus seepicola TaxID=2828781 RepID=A0A9J6P5X4_9CLOT|nr:sterol desaturase family protein [Oceanirhabdus seepicola]MCM1991213.1 sterol desaturase family protein [Oceanirhabdus seepicola]
MKNLRNIRIGAFLGTLVIMIILQKVKPRRKWEFSFWKRGFSNISIVILNNLLIFLVLPLVPIKMAFIVQEKGIGLLNNINIFKWIKVLIEVLLLDMLVYWQHRIFHKIGFLWKLHKMHHVDLELDSTTGVRFHPIEIIISTLLKVGLIALIGASPISVVIFEIILNSASLFNHANIYISLKADKILRKVLITPDMHRVHHSIHMNERNSNFGFSVPWWDFIFKSYKAQPKGGHVNMKLGIEDMPEEKYTYFPGMLLVPFITNKYRGK